MVSDLMMSGAELLVIGMGTVFVFLSVLVVAVTVMSKFARSFDKAEPAAPEQEAPKGTSSAHIAAISAAVGQYRSTQGS